MDLVKWAISIAAAALVGVLIWLGVAHRAGGPAPSPGAFKVERGTLAVGEGGTVIETEEFFLSITDIQIDLHSDVTLASGGGFTQRYRLTRELAPVRYFRQPHALLQGRRVLVEADGQQVRVELIDDGAPRARQLGGVPPLVLLDDDVYSHYIVLSRLAAVAPGGPFGTAIRPQTGEAVALTLGALEPAKLVSGARLVEVQHRALTVGNAPVRLYILDGTLIAIALPQEGRFIHRVDLFPEGLREV